MQKHNFQIDCNICQDKELQLSVLNKIKRGLRGIPVEFVGLLEGESLAHRVRRIMEGRQNKTYILIVVHYSVEIAEPEIDVHFNYQNDEEDLGSIIISELRKIMKVNTILTGLEGNQILISINIPKINSRIKQGKGIVQAITGINSTIRMLN